MIWKRAKVSKRFLSNCVSSWTRSTNTTVHWDTCYLIAEEEDDDAEGEVEGEVEDEEEDA